MKKVQLSILMTILTLINLPLTTLAAKLPFDPNRQHEIKPVESSDFLGGLISTFTDIVTPLYGWAVNIISVLFVIGAVVMMLAVLFRNGQWQKYAQGTMFYSFITMLILRGLPIIILSIRTQNDIDVLLQESLTSLSSFAIFLGILSISASLLFRFGYKLIEHPDFHRWSKNLLSVSALMMVLAIAIPWLFPQI